ncbi:hypothetical protein B0J14DRAFT_657985 [Halenospora varia]|nr:hypothetical protein B0J14DRAFT_657985 [Halenospora varia]
MPTFKAMFPTLLATPATSFVLADLAAVAPDLAEEVAAEVASFSIIFPMYVPVTIPNILYMNWSCVIVGATIVFPGAYWIHGTRHKYLKGSNSVLEDNVVIVYGEARLARDVLKI